MVTKTIKMKISIPDSLYRYRWENIKRYMKWIFTPPRCYSCDKKMVFNDHQLALYDEDGVRKMMMNYSITGSYGEFLCQECLTPCIIDRNAVAKSGHGPVSKEDMRRGCDCCGEMKMSYKWIAFFGPQGKKIGIISGREWWNGFYFCTDCLRNIVENGVPMSNHLQIIKKDGETRVVQSGAYNLPVVDGRVRFPY